jgi:hypothetical protein
MVLVLIAWTFTRFTLQPAGGGTPSSPVTALLIDLEAGPATYEFQEYMPEGTTWSFTAHTSSDQEIAVFNVMTRESGLSNWTISFRPPSGQQLSPGTYAGADWSSGLGAGIDLVAGGSSCGAAVGSFTIHQIVRNDANAIDRFAASFEIHCGWATQAWFGELHYHSTGVELPALTVSPFSMSFEGATRTRNVLLTNRGTVGQDLSFELRGAQPNAYAVPASTCLHIAAGASCSIPVTFSGVGAGPISAELLIRDDTRRGYRRVLLTATGTPTSIVLLTPSANPVASGAPVTLTAKVAGMTGGTMDFIVDDRVAASAPIQSNGTAAVTITLPAGAHWVIASARGATSSGSESAPLRLVVQP